MTALAVVAALAVSLAACGKDDKPITTANGQPVTTAATTPTTLAPVSTTAAPKPTVATANLASGTVMVDATGKTLYTRDTDPAGSSSCTGNCAATWPPLVLAGGATTAVAGSGVTSLTVAARPDDATKMQVLWNGKALYTYAADSAQGDTKGDGVGGIWHVAKPA